MLADNHLPRYDTHHAQFKIIHAPPQTTYQALHETPLHHDPLLTQIPRLTRLTNTTPQNPETIGDLLEALPLFTLEEDPPNELVLGAIAPLRDPTTPIRTDLEPADYQTFHEPHHAKLLLSIATHPRNDESTILAIEARTRATHPRDRTQLEWTMRLTRPARALLINRALNAIQHHAQQQPPPREPLDLHATPNTIPTLNDVNLNERTALLRVDINSPLEEGTIRNPERLHQAAQTIQTLQDENAKTIVIAHQGRPGQPDCITLEEHARILNEHTTHPLTHTPHIADEEALNAIQNTQPGETLLLENIRFAPGETEDTNPEEHAKRGWIQRLTQHADIYVNDAFPVTHRDHASITGPPQRLPSVAGPNLAREIETLDGIQDQPKPHVMALGGVKIKNSLNVALHQLTNDRIDTLLTGGLLGMLLLEANGVDTGQGTRAILEERNANELLPQARTLLEANEDRLILPRDVAIQEGGKRLEIPIEDLPAKGGAKDIGSETANRFADAIAHAGTAIIHGPMGVYEKTNFSRGTAQVLAAAAKGDAYAIVGGGHTVGALSESGIDPSQLDHISLAGGALLEQLAGNKLPGIEALRAPEKPPETS